jgi:hypothetical protein
MSSIVPIARTVVKKVTPKTKKGKVAAAGAAAFGIGMANRDNSKPATTTALAPTESKRTSDKWDWWKNFIRFRTRYSSKGWS